MVYNKTLFEELGLTVPSTYEELKSVCEAVAAEGITPWFMPGADGWQHQLAFFQIGGVYEEETPGLYDALNNNTATFADNEKMIEVLEQFKELSDLGYFGEDWIGTDSTNMANEFGDRNCAMAMANSSYIQQILDETGTSDEFGLFLIPLGDNDTYPTNPAGPTMFGYKGTEHEDLVRLFFDFVCQTDSLQEILDNSPAYTNLQVNADIEQHWLDVEEEFISTVDESKMVTSVLQTGTKYTNDYWSDFGADMVAYCQGTMEANDVLANMDANRAAAAEAAGDEAWQ
jgi:raffinose/stachyose/melibiose transport system substrate-binding protein